MSAVPLHRLNTPQTKLWNFGGILQRKMASQLARKYRTGVGLLDFRQLLIAYINPTGGVRTLAPPHQFYPMWMIANAPRPLECPCADFIDLENQAPWRERGTSQHHPMCQFDKHSQAVYRRIMRETQEGAQSLAEIRERVKRQRPDAWTRVQEEVRGTRTSKSGPRTR
jgi:hypothetical protein